LEGEIQTKPTHELIGLQKQKWVNVAIVFEEQTTALPLIFPESITIQAPMFKQYGRWHGDF
jgi:hypothetical protein